MNQIEKDIEKIGNRNITERKLNNKLPFTHILINKNNIKEVD